MTERTSRFTGISAADLEAALYDELERLYEKGAISAFDKALRLGARLREKRGETIPLPIVDGKRSGGSATESERIIALRTLLAAGVDLDEVRARVTGRRGVVLPGGIMWKQSKAAWSKFVAKLAIGDTQRTRDLDTAALIRTAELQRLQRVAAKAEQDGNWQAAHRASERVLAYVDDVAPPEPMRIEEQAARLAGRLFDERALARFDVLFEQPEDMDDE